METIEKELVSTKASANGIDSIARNWINGEWVDSEKHSMSYNPATAEPIGMYADGGLEEAEKAVTAAVRAFNDTSWKNDYALRSKVLLAIADQIEVRSKDLIQMLCAEGGKIGPEAAMEVHAAPAFLRHWAGKTFT